MKRSSLTEKMVLYFLLLGIGSIVITGFFSFSTARSALLDRTYDQLTSLRLSRQMQIETFFNDRLHETAHYACYPSVKTLVADAESGSKPLIDAESSYFASGYFSGILIFDTTGKIIYRSLSGNESLALSYDSINVFLRRDYEEAFIMDYQTFGRRAEPQLLSICAIKNKNTTIAYLGLIIEPQIINDYMFGVDASNGLGYSGETYLVGPDYLMRSPSRFIPQSVMHTKVITAPVIEALEGKQGIAQIIDYRQTEVLSSYGSIHVNGLNWVMLAEIDYNEAMSSIYAIRNNIMLLTVLIGVAFFIISFVISRRITKPIIRLKDAAIEFGEGRLTHVLDNESNDEIGELTEAFNRMAINLREKDEALKQERINRLKSAIDGQDQERQRLSRELHDGIGQSLIAVRLKLGAMENSVSDKMRPSVVSVIALSDNLIDEVRAISNALMPPALVEFGLSAAIRHLCNDLSEIHGITTDFRGEIPNDILGRKARLYLFRIFQEALNNISKHSGATEVNIVSEVKEGSLCILIADNGKGLGPETTCSPKGHGLNNIRERAGLLKGSAEIVSIPGKGTSITIEIPVNKIKS
ncbi:MAG: HAMP domain-containing protein [Lentimicrobium sp.]|jgi:signal transduction histidine kinase|nr:HAMP domain-containing protein [Lentimicrobium sp.]